jgi:hypothetical protein
VVQFPVELPSDMRSWWRQSAPLMSAAFSSAIEQHRRSDTAAVAFLDQVRPRHLYSEGTRAL